MRSSITIFTQSGPVASPNVCRWRYTCNTTTLIKQPCRLTPIYAGGNASTIPIPTQSGYAALTQCMRVGTH